MKLPHFDPIFDTIPLVAIIATLLAAIFFLQPAHVKCQNANILGFAENSEDLGLEHFSTVYVVTTDKNVMEGYMPALDYFNSKPGDVVIACETIGNWIPYSFDTRMERIER